MRPRHAHSMQTDNNKLVFKMMPSAAGSAATQQQHLQQNSTSISSNGKQQQQQSVVASVRPQPLQAAKTKLAHVLHALEDLRYVYLDGLRVRCKLSVFAGRLTPATLSVPAHHDPHICCASNQTSLSAPSIARLDYLHSSVGGLPLPTTHQLEALARLRPSSLNACPDGVVPTWSRIQTTVRAWRGRWRDDCLATLF